MSTQMTADTVPTVKRRMARVTRGLLAVHDDMPSVSTGISSGAGEFAGLLTHTVTLHRAGWRAALEVLATASDVIADTTAHQQDDLTALDSARGR